MFVDSSVIVAILADEPDADQFLDRLAQAQCSTSALVVLESAMRLSTILKADPVLVERRIQTFLEAACIAVMPIEAAVAPLAVAAFAKYGKGRGHGAHLNLADCLSYACAKLSGVALLYKGDDFSRTDMA
jgi:ribonuclease VapC